MRAFKDKVLLLTVLVSLVYLFMFLLTFFSILRSLWHKGYYLEDIGTIKISEDLGRLLDSHACAAPSFCRTPPESLPAIYLFSILHSLSKHGLNSILPCLFGMFPESYFRSNTAELQPFLKKARLVLLQNKVLQEGTLFINQSIFPNAEVCSALSAHLQKTMGNLSLMAYNALNPSNIFQTPLKFEKTFKSKNSVKTLLEGGSKWIELVWFQMDKSTLVYKLGKKIFLILRHKASIEEPVVLNSEHTLKKARIRTGQEKKCFCVREKDLKAYKGRSEEGNGIKECRMAVESFLDEVDGKLNIKIIFGIGGGDCGLERDSLEKVGDEAGNGQRKLMVYFPKYNLVLFTMNVYYSEG